MIRNERTGEVLCRGEIHCRSFFSLGMGLRFRRGKSAALCFEKARRVTLDMWFVFYPIDVLFLDEKKRIIEIKRDLRPWRNYTLKRECSYAVEIKRLKALNVRLGDRLVFTV